MRRVYWACTDAVPSEDSDTLMEKFAVIHPRRVALANSVQRHSLVNQYCFLHNTLACLGAVSLP